MEPSASQPTPSAPVEAKPQLKAEPKPAQPATVPVEPQAKAVVSTTIPAPTTLPTPTTLPEQPRAAPERPEAREAPEVRPHTPGAVAAHPVPAAPKPAPPVAEAAPRRKPAGAADGVKIVPADPVSPTPAPGAGTAAKPVPDRQATGGGGVGSGGTAEAPQEDEYAAAAERWRSRMSGGMGGMAGQQSDKGAVGDGTNATGGGGSVVGFEFLSYRQRIFGLIKSNWANAARGEGLIAAVRFDLAPDGTVSGIALVRSSGDRTYDQSVLRAVQRSSPLPPPPERYRDDFREVVIDFYSEEQAGQGAG
jgi:TonB family protein